MQARDDEARWKSYAALFLFLSTVGAVLDKYLGQTAAQATSLLIAGCLRSRTKHCLL